MNALSNAPKCQKCGAPLKGHVRGTRTFRELSRVQQRSAIAKATRDLKAMRRVFNEVREK